MPRPDDTQLERWLVDRLAEAPQLTDATLRATAANLAAGGESDG
jgi:hypothetical protein